jgi:predicted GNAT family acetyltransferase
VLGALSEPQCHQLARETPNLAFAGVVGCDDTARWFVDHATSLGISFLDPIPQQILVLTTAPKYPGAPGYARQLGEPDADRFVNWMLAFSDEAAPHDPKPTREQLEACISDGHCFFWIARGRPVSMAIIARSTRNSAAISSVYTPPLFRARGYAGSVAAAVAERILAEGRTAACLYTDLRNQFSNRCYANIGFIPVCLSYHYVRQPDRNADMRSIG